MVHGVGSFAFQHRKRLVKIADIKQNESGRRSNFGTGGLRPARAYNIVAVAFCAAKSRAKCPAIKPEIPVISVFCPLLMETV